MTTTTTATAWALEQLGQLPTAARAPHGPLASATARFTLLALAGLADEALARPTGYHGSPGTEVARIVGLAPSTAAKWLTTLATAGYAAPSVTRRGAWFIRIPGVTVHPRKELPQP